MSVVGVLILRWCFGEVDNAVTVVAAVRGRSWAAPEIASCEDGGSLPVSSSLRIRDLRSSSSSQTVEGALVDRVDSVPSRALSVSPRTRSGVSEVDGWRLLRIVDRVECRRRGSWMDDRRSPLTGGERGEVSGLVRLSLLRGAPITDREPAVRLE